MASPMLRWSVIVLPLLACAPADEDVDELDTSEAEDGDADEGGTDEGEADEGEAESADVDPDELPPIDRTALESWLADESYASWAAESAPHVSAGPHGSAVRTFFNAALADAASEGAGDYPVGAATVKELYAADGERSGWAVMVKLESGRAGDGWYWYEGVGTSVYADGTGESLCTGCHSSGIDFVRTAWPLQ